MNSAFLHTHLILIYVYVHLASVFHDPMTPKHIHHDTFRRVQHLLETSKTSSKTLTSDVNYEHANALTLLHTAATTRTVSDLIHIITIDTSFSGQAKITQTPPEFFNSIIRHMPITPAINDFNTLDSTPALSKLSITAHDLMRQQTSALSMPPPHTIRRRNTLRAIFTCFCKQE